jgi:hypothetical protein
MSLNELTQLADRAGVFRPGTALFDMPLNEPKLIRAIQKAQGLDDCFRTDQRFFCKNEDCEWRDRCFKLVASWRS